MKTTNIFIKNLHIRNIKNIQNIQNHIIIKKKIHRRYKPKILIHIPKGIIKQFITKFKKHNWHDNYDLIKLRRTLGMRIHARSELCQTLTTLSSILLLYCDYNLYSEFHCEIAVPFEILSSSMNMLHIYKNGRKSYDPPSHALKILEQLKYIIVLRDINPDIGHYMPLRIWLTPKFFTSRGISLNEYRNHLITLKDSFLQYQSIINKFLKKKKHIWKIRPINIDLTNKPTLKKLLIKTKKHFLGIHWLTKNQYLWYNKKTSKPISCLCPTQNPITNNLKYKYWYYKFINWSITQMPYYIYLLEKKLRLEKPHLMKKNPENYYKTLWIRGNNNNH